MIWAGFTKKDLVWMEHSVGQIWPAAFEFDTCDKTSMTKSLFTFQSLW